jgi:hypothetical protein
MSGTAQHAVNSGKSPTRRTPAARKTGDVGLDRKPPPSMQSLAVTLGTLVGRHVAEENSRQSAAR